MAAWSLQVLPNSAAAGVRRDVILSVNGRNVNTVEELTGPS
jgi:S1-C subfamily serine protease